MDDEREAPPTVSLEECFKSAVMVSVTVRNYERAQVSDWDLEHIQVAGKRGRCQTAVVERRTRAAVRLHLDQRREAMLRDEVSAVAEVRGEIPANVVGAGHQQIDEVVHDDRDLDMIDRLESNQRVARHSCTVRRTWSRRCSGTLL